MFWKTKPFKQEQLDWYQKLEDTGFNDIENGDVLKQNAPNSYRQAPQTVKEIKQEYFILLSQGLQRNEFDNTRDKKIMTALAENIATNEIARSMKLHKNTIRFIKRKYENRWGIRYWKLEQMRSSRKSRAIESSRTKLLKFR